MIGGAGAATWEAGTGLVGGVVDLAWCTVPLRDQGCALGELTGALIDDPNGTTAAIAQAAAQGIGSTRADLLSGDPYRSSHASFSTFWLVVGLAGGGKGALDVIRGSRAATRAAEIGVAERAAVGLDRTAVGPVTWAPEALGSGPVRFRPPPGATAEEIAQVRAYCQACNDALAEGRSRRRGVYPRPVS